MSSPTTTDIGTALSNLITTIINAFTTLFTGFANWLSANADTIANIIGWVMLGVGVVGVVAYFGRRIYDLLRGFVRL
ncbi:MAG: hypothetical protein JZD41_07860 [Thermoproteus sp.]|nr:hypothetical protein [Thermoproteus sp.]